MHVPPVRTFALRAALLVVCCSVISTSTAGAKGKIVTPPATPVLSSVSFSPATVAGGSPSTGTIKFGAATDGAVVTLFNSHPTIVSVPAEAVVFGGQSSGAFPVTTKAVTAPTVVTIMATAFGVSRTGTLTVTPATAPATNDTVTIPRALWSAGILRIEATSTNPNAILTVHLTVNDSFMFTLANLGGGRFQDQRPWLDNPQSITVRSNFGGFATRSTVKWAFPTSVPLA